MVSVFRPGTLTPLACGSLESRIAHPDRPAAYVALVAVP
jgi:hypothetical protein